MAQLKSLNDRCIELDKIGANDQHIIMSVPEKNLQFKPKRSSFTRELGGQRLTEGMNVLSWDCGISNLSYCLLELYNEESSRVVMWENINLNSSTMMQATEQLVKEICDRPWMMNCDFVCIENQVMKNVLMKTLSHVIQCCFLTRGQAPPYSRSPSVHFIKAESKFKGITNQYPIPIEIEQLDRRSRNKKGAVYIVTRLLQDQKDYQALRFFESFTKRDDLADSFLQGLYFLSFQAKRKAQQQKIIQCVDRKSKKEKRIVIDKKVGTKDESYDDYRLNEGCEYERECPLPQLYRNQRYLSPLYHVDHDFTSKTIHYGRLHQEPSPNDDSQNETYQTKEEDIETI